MLIAFETLLAFATCLTLLSLFRLPGSAEKRTKQRFATVLSPIQPRAGEVLALSEPSGARDSFQRRLAAYKWTAPISRLLVAAGSQRSLGSLARLSLGSALLCGVLIHALSSTSLLILPAVAFGAFLPVAHLQLQRSRRLKAFNCALPDGVDLLARALRAGHSMSSAIEMVGEQSVVSLGREFLTLFQEQKCGITLREALLNMGRRVPSQDLQFLITAILLQRETGGDLTEILTRTTHVIRERVRIQAEVKVYTAQGRLTGWILGALPVAMLGFISIANPGYCNVLFHDPIGQKLLFAGGTCIVIGCFVISRIVDIKV